MNLNVKKLLISVTLALVTSACQERNYYSPTSPSPTPTTPRTSPNPNPSNPTQTTRIEFRVSGTPSSARIRFTNAVDGTTQVVSNLPYVATITTQESSMFLSLEATSVVSTTFELYPFMAVQIFVNGTLFREAISVDLFSELSVSGTWRR